MDPIVIIGGIVLLPVIILTLVRANAATAFLALCLGSVLGSFVAADTVNLLRGYVAPDSRLTESVISLLLLWLPVILVAIFMSHTIAPKQRIINAFPALAVGLLGAMLSVPFLTPAVSEAIEASGIWSQLLTYQAAIVATGTAVSLVMLRMRNKDHSKHGKH